MSLFIVNKKKVIFNSCYFFKIKIVITVITRYYIIIHRAFTTSARRDSNNIKIWDFSVTDVYDSEA